MSTARCPRGGRCESCGREGKGLAVRELASEAGTICLTLCPTCQRAPRLAAQAVTRTTARRLAAQHAEHGQVPDR